MMIFQPQFCHCSLCIHLSWINPIAISLQCRCSRDLTRWFLLTLNHYGSSTLLFGCNQKPTHNRVKSAPENLFIQLISTLFTDSFHKNFSSYNPLLIFLKLFCSKNNHYNISQIISLVFTLFTQSTTLVIVSAFSPSIYSAKKFFMLKLNSS